MNAADVEPLAIVDVQYDGDSGHAACIVAAHWTDGAALEERTARIANVAPYRPGAFYERELPCILQVLAMLQTTVRAVVIDGYVELDAQGTPGLGAHLHDRIAPIAVIGVAKTAFRGSAFARAVTRGSSKNPLYVTARGIPAADAAHLLSQMHGAHRIPTLLARVDRLARGA